MAKPTTFQDLLNRNSVGFLGLSAFLQAGFENNFVHSGDKAIDPILAKYFNGMPPQELLSQFKQHVESQRHEARLKLAMKPGNSGVRKELADEYIPTIKPYKPF